MIPTIGFIGAGNMARSIFIGAIQKNIVLPDQVYLYDIDDAKLDAYQKEYHVHAAHSMQALVQQVDMVFLCVKPNIAPSVLETIDLSKKAMISIVTGLSMEMISAYPGCKNARILRVMPNTPLLVGQGASVFAKPCTLSEEEFSFASNLFSVLGTVFSIGESLFSAVTGISGSGPAYGYLFLEALSDAGVKHGLPREMATALAAQTLLGAAAMVQQTKEHPGKLKDQVCSPGGTTIEAVAKLEETGFRSSIIKAVDACVEKADCL